MPAWLPILLVVHIGFALALLAPSVIVPFLLRRSPDAGTRRGALTGLLLRTQGSGTLLIGGGVAASGVALLLTVGLSLLTRPWMLVALGLYAMNLLVAAFVSRPNLRRLLRLGSSDEVAWQRRARRQRYVAYAMAAATGGIGLLMSTKPVLW